MPNIGASRAGQVFLYTILLLCSAAFLLPLLLAVTNSLNPWNAMPSILPRGWHFENYVYATTMLKFWLFLKNSLIISAISVITTTLSSGLVGYAFARIDARGKNMLFMIILATMMLPGIVTQIPMYILFHKFGLLDTFYPWLIWGLGGSPFFIFLFRQFFSAIPKELEEAARIDGCSIFRTYWNIFLPVSMPAIATAAIMCFQFAWGDFIGPFMFLSEEKYPLATALSTIGYTRPGNVRFVIQQVSSAAAILFMLPIVAVFFFGQRFLIEGIVTTGIKG